MQQISSSAAAEERIQATAALGMDLRRILLTVRAESGCEPRCEERTRNHQNYLRRFFAELNAGAKKSPLPRWLRWAKAPGDQLFYWGDLPRYRRQEPVTEVSLLPRAGYPYDHPPSGFCPSMMVWTPCSKASFMPGSLRFHSTPSSRPQSRGSSSARAIPWPVGPRNWGQSAPASSAL